MVFLFFFFFQAEDGIRDRNVTGVQTCALPILTTLRAAFDARYMSVNARENAIVLRAPKRLLDAAARLINGLSDGRPEVMLDIHIYQVSRSTLRSLGMDLPLQFQMFNLTSAALALGGTNVQDLINQAIA